MADALATPSVPSLDSGARLTRFEFERRYEASPPKLKAELVEGVVYVGSPVRVLHGKPHAHVMAWLGTHNARHADLQLGDNVTVFLDAENEVQPDACLWREQAG